MIVAAAGTVREMELPPFCPDATGINVLVTWIIGGQATIIVALVAAVVWQARRIVTLEDMLRDAAQGVRTVADAVASKIAHVADLIHHMHLALVERTGHHHRDEDHDGPSARRD